MLFYHFTIFLNNCFKEDFLLLVNIIHNRKREDDIISRKTLLILSLLLAITVILSGCDTLPLYFDTYTVKGTITNSNGDPIENATISFSNGDSPVKSKSDGSWYKTGLGGTVNITVQKTGYTFTPEDYTVESERNNLNFQSNEKEISLSGTVTTGGSGLADVSIRFDSGAYSAITDSNGDWSKTLIIEDSVIVEPNKSGYTFEPTEQTLQGSDSNVDFEATAN